MFDITENFKYTRNTHHTVREKIERSAQMNGKYCTNKRRGEKSEPKKNTDTKFETEVLPF